MAYFNRFLFVVLMCVAPCVSHSADIKKFGPTLCGDGYLFGANKCNPIEQGRCPSGYYKTIIDQASFTGPSENKKCLLAPIPDGFSVIWDGVFVKFGPTLCGTNAHMVNGKCEEKKRGLCKKDFYQTNFNQATFIGLTVTETMDNYCGGAYYLFELDDNQMYPIWSGVLVNFGAKLCGADYLYRDGACVARTRGECGESFYDLRVADETMMVPENGLCEKSYSYYSKTPNCAENKGGEALCAILCGDGLVYTSAGTCATRCNMMKSLRASNNISIPLWSTPQTRPSLVIGHNGDMCYGNLVQNAGRGTINIKMPNGVQYHAKD